MKNILEFVINQKIKPTGKRPEKWNGCKFPKIDSIAYDYNGDIWRVLAYCSMDETEYYGKYNTIDKLLDKFDDNDIMSGMIDEKEVNDDDLLVAASNGKENIVAVWGQYGICYENKK